MAISTSPLLGKKVKHTMSCLKNKYFWFSNTEFLKKAMHLQQCEHKLGVYSQNTVSMEIFLKSSSKEWFYVCFLDKK